MKVGIIGLGNMGGVIASKLYTAGHSLLLFDKNLFKLSGFRKLSKVSVSTSWPRVFTTNFLVLAVKPQDMAALAVALKGRIRKSTVVVSIAAGLGIKKIQHLFGHKKVIRIMPSLATAVGQGVAFWKAAKEVSVKEKKQAKNIFTCFTEEFEVRSENLIDCGSIIYGSGPAYFFLLAAHLEKVAVGLGISRPLSRKLVEKTFLGAAWLQRDKNYGALIKKVASKKGITEVALKVFERKGFQKMVEQAVAAGFKRAKQLDHGK